MSQSANWKGEYKVRIDGKRASEFSQDDIILMLFEGKSLKGEPLTNDQKAELARTYNYRYDEEHIIQPYFNHRHAVLKHIHNKED